MSSYYDQRKTELINQINSQKAIYKFRVFLYSLNKDIRHRCFSICLDFLQNELQNQSITMTERDRLINLINHWQLNDFDHNATNWWSSLSSNHSNSIILMTLIHLWIDDINTFDPESFETSSLGLR